MLEDEPILAVHDIQGHIFPGFGSAHSVVAAFRLDKDQEGRVAVGKLLPEITTMASSLRDKESRRIAFRSGLSFPSQPIASLALAFSSKTLRRWGFSDTNQETNFSQGMLNDLRSIGDPINAQNHPEDWLFGHTEQTSIDMLLVGGHSSETAMKTTFERWLGFLESSWQLVHDDWCRRRPGDKEFFGFKDGISQPAMRGLSTDGNPVSRRIIDPDDPRSEEFARPGQRLVWPGNFIFGYEREVSSSTEPGSVFSPPQPWMLNGSYLVYRRLNQDVTRFQEAVEALQADLVAKGEDVDKDWISARLVGRWKDGSPVILTPDAPNPEIGDDSARNNNFQYQFKEEEVRVVLSDGSIRLIPPTRSDPRGKIVPQSSHIRQVNPRASLSEEGAEKHPLKLMLRRGVTFGKEIEDEPDSERGLIFLSYQTSIANQFLFVQSTWANSRNAPASVGSDPIIGQDGTDNPQRTITFPSSGRRPHQCPFHGRWVIPTAGAYLFAPSMKGLRAIVGFSDCGDEG